MTKQNILASIIEKLISEPDRVSRAFRMAPKQVIVSMIDVDDTTTAQTLELLASQESLTDIESRRREFQKELSTRVTSNLKRKTQTFTSMYLFNILT